MIHMAIKCREIFLSLFYYILDYKNIKSMFEGIGVECFKILKTSYWTRKVSFFYCEVSGRPLFVKQYKGIYSLTREVQVLNYLNSYNDRNIVNIEFSEKNQNSLFLGMEVVDGTTISENFFRKDRDCIISVIEQTVAFLDRLNEYQVIHCDIRPDNIMLDKCYNLKVIDFEYSVVKSIDNLSQLSASNNDKIENLGGQFSCEGLVWDDAYSFYSIYSLFLKNTKFEKDLLINSRLYELKKRIGRNIYEHST